MKSHREIISMHTDEREQVIDITEAVREACARSGIADGFALVFPHHTSSAVYISDIDHGLTEDLREVLGQLAPEGPIYAHDRADPKANAHAHLRTVLAGHHCTLPVTGGELDLGAHQTIYYAEFDGRRHKEIVVKFIGE